MQSDSSFHMIMQTGRQSKSNFMSVLTIMQMLVIEIVIYNKINKIIVHTVTLHGIIFP